VPSSPRAMSFVYHAFNSQIHRTTSENFSLRMARPSPSRIAAHTSHQRSTSTAVPSIKYSNQLSIFVIFDKKAGIIRISDAAVSEVELHEEGGLSSQQSNTGFPALDTFLSASNTPRRPKSPWEGFGFVKDKASWVLPEKIDLAPSVATSSLYLFTRGRSTHVLPCPLPNNVSDAPSLYALRWSCTPKHVKARVCRPALGRTPLSFIQLIAFGEEGIEVQEIPLRLLIERKGKSLAEPVVQGVEDLGGETAPLCVGGHWHRLSLHSEYSRYSSTVITDAEQNSPGDCDTDDLVDELRRERGIYGWVQKDLSDWRVFWVGGTGEVNDNDSGSPGDY
jgi:hypothetical protein